MKKVSFIFLFFLFSFLVIGGFFLVKYKEKEYSMNFFYFDTYIELKFYTKDQNKAEKAKQEVESIYKEYHRLASRYEEYGKNVFYLIHNDSKEKTIQIEKKLYELLEYSLDWTTKSNGKFDIHIGCVVDVWKKYRDFQSGIPTMEELNACNHYEKLTLLEDYQVLNNHADIDLGAVAKGYATQKVGEYFKEQGITKFLVNAGGNVLTGLPYQKETFQIGIQNPDEKDVFKILNVKNLAVVTSGGYERYYEFEGKRYHHILDPDTKYPGNYVKSVTILAKDSALADVLSTTLFLMDVERGKEFLKTFPGVEAIWYTKDNQVIMTEGVFQYE